MKANLPRKYSIYQKKGKLYAVVYHPDSGKRKWLSTGLDVGTKKKTIDEVAIPIVEAFYEELNTAKVVKSESESNDSNIENIGFIAFMDKWLEYKKSRVAKKSYEAYSSAVNGFKKFFENKNLSIQFVKPIDIQDYYNSLMKKGLKISTVKNRHICIHNIFEYAIKLELISVNPTSRVELPKSEKHKATFYTKAELEELFKVFEGDRMELIVHIAAYYGLRRSEVIGLKWDSIDFDQKTITVCRKVITVKGDDGKYKPICEDTLKTESTRRTLPLMAHIEKLLLIKKEEQKNYQRLLGDAYCKDNIDFICTDKLGKLITPHYVTAHFRYVVQKNELRYLRFHDLRHTCASLLIANHIQLKSVQDWLGHANFNTTANIYSHLDYSSRIESAAAIANVLGDVKSGFDEKPDEVKESKKDEKIKSSYKAKKTKRGRKKATPDLNEDTSETTSKA